MAPLHGFYAKSTLISLVIDSENGLRDSASGFFYEFKGNRFVVTNKHVLEFPESEVYSDGEGDSLMNPDEVYIYIRDDPNNLTNVSRFQLELFDPDEEALWIEHPNQDVDLVAIPLDIDFSTIHNIPYSRNDFVDDEIEILGGDSAIAIGYPKGLYDAQTYFPVARDGLISTPPNGTYKGLPVFLMDAKMHGGTSGSPVISQPSPIQRKEDGIALMDGATSYLLGVHSGPEYAPPPRDGSEEYDPNLDLHMVWQIEVLEELLEQGLNDL